MKISNGYREHITVTMKGGMLKIEAVDEGDAREPYTEVEINLDFEQATALKICIEKYIEHVAYTTRKVQESLD